MDTKFRALNFTSKVIYEIGPDSRKARQEKNDIQMDGISVASTSISVKSRKM
jgi:hypothetical protein